MLFEDEVSLRFADLKLLELSDLSDFPPAPKSDLTTLREVDNCIKMTPLCFSFTHLQNVTTQQLLISV